MGILAWSKVLPPTVKREVSLTELTPTESPSGGLVPTFGDPRWSLLAEAGPGQSRSRSPGDVTAAATVALGNPQDLRDPALIPDQELYNTLSGIRLGEAPTPLTAGQSTWSQAHD